jgi:hypothetical protein
MVTTPHRLTPRETVALMRPAIRLRAVLIVAAAIAAAVAATSLRGGMPRRAASATPAPVPTVATAHAYPLACLSVAIALHDPRFARPSFDSRLPCERRVNVTGLFYRWQPTDGVQVNQLLMDVERSPGGG